MTLELYVLTETRKDMHTFEQVNNRSHDVGTSFESTPYPLTVKQSFVHFYSKTTNTDLHFPLANSRLPIDVKFPKNVKPNLEKNGPP